MKTIGIIGGLSPASTVKYYQWLNDGMREQLGGHHSAKIIYSELTKGVVLDESRAEYMRVISKLRDQGAQGVVLGCTEITMIVDPQDCPIPVFDTTRIHVDEALQFALRN